MQTIVIKPGREKSMLRRHPWVFPGAVKRVMGNPGPGSTIEIRSAGGQFLGTGFFSPNSRVRSRIWTFEPNIRIDETFFQKKIETALTLRSFFGFPEKSNAFRLINSEADGLPGIIVDQYGKYLACQFLTTGAERWKKVVIRLLENMVPAEGIYERSRGEGRKSEGLPPISGLLSGKAPPEFVDIREGSARFRVDIRNGHKTGFYLDQRENRRLLGRWCRDKSVLNCFSYTGGFGIHALLGGASALTNIDISENAMAVCRKNIEENGFSDRFVEYLTEDVFDALRTFRDQDRRFDVIVLDPPKFAATAATVKRAVRGYKDINLLALKLLTPGGLLFTFSCSGHISPSLFQKTISDAAVDAGRDVRIPRFLNQAADHIISPDFPEGHYLKGLMLAVM